ncbi:MAG: RagB/SusD family nutrient uptake outer membrane protein, partial [Bacteroidales bacterium]|nr:RagB/SusD family nutrient uptake outer membrane protein [Bacteroidales bacterium]
VSCEKEILDKKPLDIISDAQVWNDPALIQAYVTNLYSRAHMSGIFGGWFWGDPYYGSPVDELIYTDEARLAWDWGPSDWQKGVVNGGNNSMAYWDYNYIRACNEFLVLIEGGSVSDEIKKQNKAEVRFLRAYAYFEMVKRYGGVPIVKTPQKQSEGEALFVSRNTEEEVYDFIGEECDAINVDLLEAQAADKTGRATKFAALALKSRAMLYAASIAKYGTVQNNGIVGIPAEKASAYFQKSYDASKEIITPGKFQLFNKYPDKVKNYQMLFLEKNNPEIILAKKFVSVIQGHSFDYYSAPESFKTDWGNMV